MCFFISFIARASLSSGTAHRTMSQPASSSSLICFTVAFTSRVNVFVMDWTATGLPPPMTTRPILTAFVFLTRGLCSTDIDVADAEGFHLIAGEGEVHLFRRVIPALGVALEKCNDPFRLAENFFDGALHVARAYPGDRIFRAAVPDDDRGGLLRFIVKADDQFGVAFFIEKIEFRGGIGHAERFEDLLLR